MAATPEEVIRQGVLALMLGEKGYPAAWIAVERAFASLQFGRAQERLPQRRVDIVVFAKAVHPDYPLFPLLLIECKAVALDDAALQQLIGYHAYLPAPFLALANGERICTGEWHQERRTYLFQEGLPHYQTLIAAVGQKKEGLSSQGEMVGKEFGA